MHTYSRIYLSIQISQPGLHSEPCSEQEHTGRSLAGVRDSHPLSSHKSKAAEQPKLRASHLKTAIILPRTRLLENTKKSMCV